MKHIGRFFKILMKCLLGFIGFIALYVFCSEQFSAIKWNTPCCVAESEGVAIYVKSNGVHTDIVLPVKQDSLSWADTFPVNTFERVGSSCSYISFGWGDKGFYLETPTWADLKASTAFKASFFMSTTAMHVSYRAGATLESENCVKLIISKEQYRNLCGAIMNSFALKNGKVQLIDHPGYSDDDNFYEAVGTYSLFQTCNVWTGRQLHNAGIRVGYWTPLEKNVMSSIRE